MHGPIIIAGMKAAASGAIVWMAYHIAETVFCATPGTGEKSNPVSALVTFVGVSAFFLGAIWL